MKVNGVEEEEVPRHRRKGVNGIKDGGHIHQKLREHRPEVLHIPEKDEQRREDQPYSDIKQEQRQDRHEQQRKLPRERDAVDDTEHEEHDEHQPEIDERLHVFGKQKQILRYIHFCENGRVPHERGHALAGGLAEIRKDQVAAEQIGGVVLHIAPEELGKHNPHDKQLQKRRKNAPRHAQHGALVFFLEVPLDELFEEELKAFYFLEHL